MLRDTLIHDLKRYIATDEIRTRTNLILFILFNMSFWFIVNYRIGQWARQGNIVSACSLPMKLMTLILSQILTILTGYQIPFSAKIGSGLYIGHYGMLIINGNAQIGKNCNLSSGVVIGQGGRGANKGTPIIGDNVYVAPGAKIFGAIHIGSNVAIGANAVVTKDVPDNAVVVGVPAKVINYNGSKEFIRY